MTPAEAGAYFAAPFDVSQSVARVAPLPPVRKPAVPAAPKLRCVLCGRTLPGVRLVPGGRVTPAEARAWFSAPFDPRRSVAALMPLVPGVDD